MNRLTITIELSDDVEFQPSNIVPLEAGFREILLKFVDNKDIKMLDVFQETKKRYHF